jgi:hypothetical protein
LESEVTKRAKTHECTAVVERMKRKALKLDVAIKNKGRSSRLFFLPEIK